MTATVPIIVILFIAIVMMGIHIRRKSAYVAKLERNLQRKSRRA